MLTPGATLPQVKILNVCVKYLVVCWFYVKYTIERAVPALL